MQRESPRIDITMQYVTQSWAVERRDLSKLHANFISLYIINLFKIVKQLFNKII